MTEHDRHCRHLAWFVADPALPYRYDFENDTTCVDLSAITTVHDAFCAFCGGHEMRPSASQTPRCRCGLLTRCAGEPESRIAEGPTGSLYVMKGTGERRINCMFCPSCGGCYP